MTIAKRPCFLLTLCATLLAPQAGQAAWTLVDCDTIIPNSLLVSGGLGLPAVNDNGQVALLVSVASDPTPRPGVTVKLDGTGFQRIAKRGGATSVAGTVFASLRDPVLAADGGVAFLAKLEGPGVKGSATDSLWWLPGIGAGRDVTEVTTQAAPVMLARSGARPGVDLPADAQWKSFTSLAIAGGGRGPIFAATLVPGKGGVTPTTASGVWACDYTGAVRLLLRTGDTIDGKVVKKFTLLTATVGSTGVTRSFNDNTQVVWLATFTDKTTAIVRTEVP